MCIYKVYLSVFRWEKFDFFVNDVKGLEGERQKQLDKLIADYEKLKEGVEGQVSKLNAKNEMLQKKVGSFRQEMLNYRN